ncbi:MAG: DUF4910 domain-containing protein [Bacteroidales bacterium]|jgi:aminopeptidase YwaD|nr:DUF4910 domain-containing protein [Bacteroidales bacterium]
MKRIAVFLSVILISLSSLFSQNINLAKDALKYLASDELEGRFPGSKGDSLAHVYFTQQFKKSGLSLFDDDFYQDFEITTSIRQADDNRLKINGEMISQDNYSLYNFSANADFKSGVIALSELPEEVPESLNGQWLLVFPEFAEGEIPAYRELVQMASRAQRLGAGGVIFVANDDWGTDSEFYPFYFTRSMIRLDIPAIQFAQNACYEELLADKYPSMEKFREELKSETQIGFENIEISAHTNIEIQRSTTGNAIAYRTVDDSDEWIVIGAHYDHLGWGGYGSGSRSPERHEIHYGADDNASGAALVLMLSDYYATQNPDVNLAFILFAAEEQGLIGSKYFVENSPIPMEKIRAMLNLDMVGRVQENRISISGTSTATEFEGVLNHFQNNPLEIAMSGGGFAGSDQASFVSENIPVLFFNSGLHDDYHTPDDNIESINFEGIQQVGALSIALIDSLSHPDIKLTFQKQKQEGRVRHGGGMKVTLGIMPDVTGRVENGLAVDGVRPGGPAENAGIIKGDVIHKIDEFEIENIYDYMESLSKFKKGQKVELQIVRDDKPMKLEVEF